MTLGTPTERLRVEEFVRLAEDAVDRLAPDREVGEALRTAMATQPGDDEIDRMLRAQQVLVRVLCFERVAMGGQPLAPEQLASWQARTQLDVEEQMRLVYELCLDGARSWPSLDATPPAESDGILRRDPVLCALRTLTAGAQGGRRASYRRAADRAQVDPLGFCRLVVEEADAIGGSAAEAVPENGARTALAHVSVLLDDPFLQRQAPRNWFDLRARCALYLADGHRRSGRHKELEAQLEALPQLLSAGTGDAELRAGLLELRASCSLTPWAGEPDPADSANRLAEAEALLDAAPPDAGIPADRRVEVQLRRARVLASRPASRARAVDVLDDAAQRLERLSGAAELRRRVHETLAWTLLDLARQTVAVADPLRAGHRTGAARETLTSYAEVWRAESERLDRARAILDALEPLDPTHASDRRQAERHWAVGRSRLLSDPEGAAEALRQALARFRRLGDESESVQVAVDLIACRVIAVTDDGDVEDWSEPLRLFEELQAVWQRLDGDPGDAPDDPQTDDPQS